MLMKINNGKDFKKPDPVGAAGALAKIFSFFVRNLFFRVFGAQTGPNYIKIIKITRSSQFKLFWATLASRK